MHEVGGTSLAEVLDLMLHKPGKWEPAAHHMLDVTVRRLGPLLVGVFGAMHTSEMLYGGIIQGLSREITLRAVSTLGILLDAIGRERRRT
jgi:hypothetical protein